MEGKGKGDPPRKNLPEATPKRFIDAYTAFMQQANMLRGNSAQPGQNQGTGPSSPSPSASSSGETLHPAFNPNVASAMEDMQRAAVMMSALYGVNPMAAMSMAASSGVGMGSPLLMQPYWNVASMNLQKLSEAAAKDPPPTKDSKKHKKGEKSSASCSSSSTSTDPRTQQQMAMLHPAFAAAMGSYPALQMSVDPKQLAGAKAAAAAASKAAAATAAPKDNSQKSVPSSSTSKDAKSKSSHSSKSVQSSPSHHGQSKSSHKKSHMPSKSVPNKNPAHSVKPATVPNASIRKDPTLHASNIQRKDPIYSPSISKQETKVTNFYKDPYKELSKKKEQKVDVEEALDLSINSVASSSSGLLSPSSSRSLQSPNSVSALLSPRSDISGGLKSPPLLSPNSKGGGFFGGGKSVDKIAEMILKKKEAQKKKAAAAEAKKSALKEASAPNPTEFEKDGGGKKKVNEQGKQATIEEVTKETTPPTELAAAKLSEEKAGEVSSVSVTNIPAVTAKPGTEEDHSESSGQSKVPEEEKEEKDHSIAKQQKDAVTNGDKQNCENSDKNGEVADSVKEHLVEEKIDKKSEKQENKSNEVKKMNESESDLDTSTEADLTKSLAQNLLESLEFEGDEKSQKLNATMCKSCVDNSGPSVKEKSGVTCKDPKVTLKEIPVPVEEREDVKEEVKETVRAETKDEEVGLKESLKIRIKLSPQERQKVVGKGGNKRGQKRRLPPEPKPAARPRRSNVVYTTITHELPEGHSSLTVPSVQEEDGDAENDADSSKIGDEGEKVDEVKEEEKEEEEKVCLQVQTKKKRGRKGRKSVSPRPGKTKSLSPVPKAEPVSPKPPKAKVAKTEPSEVERKIYPRRTRELAVNTTLLLPSDIIDEVLSDRSSDSDDNMGEEGQDSTLENPKRRGRSLRKAEVSKNEKDEVPLEKVPKNDEGEEELPDPPLEAEVKDVEVSRMARGRRRRRGKARGRGRARGQLTLAPAEDVSEDTVVNSAVNGVCVPDDATKPESGTSPRGRGGRGRGRARGRARVPAEAETRITRRSLRTMANTEQEHNDSAGENSSEQKSDSSLLNESNESVKDNDTLEISGNTDCDINNLHNKNDTGEKSNHNSDSIPESSAGYNENVDSESNHFLSISKNYENDTGQVDGSFNEKNEDFLGDILLRTKERDKILNSHPVLNGMVQKDCDVSGALVKPIDSENQTTKKKEGKKKKKKKNLHSLKTQSSVSLQDNELDVNITESAKQANEKQEKQELMGSEKQEMVENESQDILKNENQENAGKETCEIAPPHITELKENSAKPAENSISHIDDIISAVAAGNFEKSDDTYLFAKEQEKQRNSIDSILDDVCSGNYEHTPITGHLPNNLKKKKKKKLLENGEIVPNGGEKKKKKRKQEKQVCAVQNTVPLESNRDNEISPQAATHSEDSQQSSKGADIDKCLTQSTDQLKSPTEQQHNQLDVLKHLKQQSELLHKTIEKSKPSNKDASVYDFEEDDNVNDVNQSPKFERQRRKSLCSCKDSLKPCACDLPHSSSQLPVTSSWSQATPTSQHSTGARLDEAERSLLSELMAGLEGLQAEKESTSATKDMKTPLTITPPSAKNSAVITSMLNSPTSSVSSSHTAIHSSPHKDGYRPSAPGLMRVPTPEPSLSLDNAVSITIQQNKNYHDNPVLQSDLFTMYQQQQNQLKQRFEEQQLQMQQGNQKMPLPNPMNQPSSLSHHSGQPEPQQNQLSGQHLPPTHQINTEQQTNANIQTQSQQQSEQIQLRSKDICQPDQEQAIQQKDESQKGQAQHSQQAHPQQAHPQQAHPQQAHPQQAHPQQAMQHIPAPQMQQQMPLPHPQQLPHHLQQVLAQARRDSQSQSDILAGKVLSLPDNDLKPPELPASFDDLLDIGPTESLPPLDISRPPSRMSEPDFPDSPPLPSMKDGYEADDSLSDLEQSPQKKPTINTVHMLANGNKVNLDQEAEESLKSAMDGEDMDLVNRLKQNMQEETPKCDCVPDGIFDEKIHGPYYTHLGAAKDLPSIRLLIENRTGLTGDAIRIEKVLQTPKEGRGEQGCPVAKWIIRRSGPHEKVLCVVRKRVGHHCATTVMIIGMVVWEGVPAYRADSLYDYLIRTVPYKGLETERRCGTNDQRTCACQGWSGDKAGASFSFGCSWSMYYNGCKFARSNPAKKFKLKNDEYSEKVLENKLQNLATELSPLYEKIAPDSFRNMTQFENLASACRLGKKPGRPWSGVTSCMDFCAHAHKDIHNMNNGCTTVVTLTKHRGMNVPEDEQLHVLPLAILDQTDENGSVEKQLEKVRAGALQCLDNYTQKLRIRPTPLLSKKKRKLQAKNMSDSKLNADGTPRKKPGRKPSSAPSTPSVKRSPAGMKRVYRTPDGKTLTYKFTPDGKAVKMRATAVKRKLKEGFNQKLEKALGGMAEEQFQKGMMSGMPGMLPGIHPMGMPMGHLPGHPLPPGFQPPPGHMPGHHMPPGKMHGYPGYPGHPGQVPGQNMLPNKQDNQGHSGQMQGPPGNNPQQPGQNKAHKDPPKSLPNQQGQLGEQHQSGHMPGSQGHSGKKPVHQGHPGQIPGQLGHPGQMLAQQGHPGQMSGQQGHPEQMSGQQGHPGQMPGQQGNPGQMSGQQGHPGQMPGQQGHPGQMQGQQMHPRQMPGQQGHRGQMPGQQGHPAEMSQMNMPGQKMPQMTNQHAQANTQQQPPHVARHMMPGQPSSQQQARVAQHPSQHHPLQKQGQLQNKLQPNSAAMPGTHTSAQQSQSGPSKGGVSARNVSMELSGWFEKWSARMDPNPIHNEIVSADPELRNKIRSEICGNPLAPPSYNEAVQRQSVGQPIPGNMNNNNVPNRVRPSAGVPRPSPHMDMFGSFPQPPDLPPLPQLDGVHDGADVEEQVPQLDGMHDGNHNNNPHMQQWQHSQQGAWQQQGNNWQQNSSQRQPSLWQPHSNQPGQQQQWQGGNQQWGSQQQSGGQQWAQSNWQQQSSQQWPQQQQQQHHQWAQQQQPHQQQGAWNAQGMSRNPNMQHPGQHSGQQYSGQHPGQQHQGPQHPGQQHQGPQHPGQQQPGLQHPGQQQPGLQHPGQHQPGLHHPGQQQPGPQHPGQQQPGLQQPGPQHPGQHPGQQQSGPQHLGQHPGQQHLGQLHPGQHHPGLHHPGPQHLEQQQPGQQNPGQQHPGQHPGMQHAVMQHANHMRNIPSRDGTPLSVQTGIGGPSGPLSWGSNASNNSARPHSAHAGMWPGVNNQGPMPSPGGHSQHSMQSFAGSRPGSVAPPSGSRPTSVAPVPHPGMPQQQGMPQQDSMPKQGMQQQSMPQQQQHGVTPLKPAMRPQESSLQQQQQAISQQKQSSLPADQKPQELSQEGEANPQPVKLEQGKPPSNVNQDHNALHMLSEAAAWQQNSKAGPLPGHQAPQMHQAPAAQPTEVKPEPPQPKPMEIMTDNRKVFQDSEVGGVAIALTHGAVLFEVAKRELHATTSMKNPNRYMPTRISLVFYQHKNLNYPDHGNAEFVKKNEMWKKRREDKVRADAGFPPGYEPINYEPPVKRKWPWEKEGFEDIVQQYKDGPPPVHWTWPQPLSNYCWTPATNTSSTKWIQPKTAVVGPYQKWI